MEGPGGLRPDPGHSIAQDKGCKTGDTPFKDPLGRDDQGPRILITPIRTTIKLCLFPHVWEAESEHEYQPGHKPRSRKLEKASRKIVSLLNG